jgi:hypothetical protein
VGSKRKQRQKTRDTSGAFCEISRRSGKFTRGGSSGAVAPWLRRERTSEMAQLKFGCSDPCGEAASSHHCDGAVSAVSSIGRPHRHALVPFFLLRLVDGCLSGLHVFVLRRVKLPLDFQGFAHGCE